MKGRASLRPFVSAVRAVLLHGLTALVSFGLVGPAARAQALESQRDAACSAPAEAKELLEAALGIGNPFEPLRQSKFSAFVRDQPDAAVRGASGLLRSCNQRFVESWPQLVALAVFAHSHVPQAPAAALEFATDPARSPEVRRALAGIVFDTLGPRGVDSLDRLLRDERDPEVRAWLMHLLARTGAAAARQVLERLERKGAEPTDARRKALQRLERPGFCRLDEASRDLTRVRAICDYFCPGPIQRELQTQFGWCDMFIEPPIPWGTEKGVLSAFWDSKRFKP